MDCLTDARTGLIPINHVVGNLRQKRSRRGAEPDSTITVGFTGRLDPEKHLGSSAKLARIADLLAARVAPRGARVSIGVAT